MTGHYLTDRYRSGDPDRVLYLVERFPFATLVPESGPGGGLSFLPLVPDGTAGSGVVLYGHVDNHNPFLPNLRGHRIRAVFHGPNAYISPRDYESDQFPTWNYAVAEVAGVSTVIDREADKLSCMTRMVDRLEAANGSDYRLDESDGAVRAMVGGLTFFRLDVDAMQCVFKFSQEKAVADRVRARDSLLRKLRDSQHRAVPHLAGLDTGVRP